MTSKITKSIACRIPIELYYQLQTEAQDQGLNMNDYFIKIIMTRNEAPTQIISKNNSGEQNLAITKKQPKSKKKKIYVAGSEILFPE